MRLKRRIAAISDSRLAAWHRGAIRSGRSFGANKSGAIAIIAALAVPILLLVAGGGLDYAMYLQQRQKLQAAADAAVLAGAKGLSIGSGSAANAAAVVKAIAARFVQENVAPEVAAGLKISSAVKDDPLAVSVDIELPVSFTFAKGFGPGGALIKVHATAQVVGQPNICVLGLNSSANGTISLEKNALVTGENVHVPTRGVTRSLSAGVA
jgi:hypothetical protein